MQKIISFFFITIFFAIFLSSASAWGAFHFSLNPDLGFDTEQYKSSVSSSPFMGYHYGMGIDIGYQNGRRTFAAMLNGSYLAGNLTNTAKGGDNITEGNILYGLGIRINRIMVRGGLLQATVNNTYSGASGTIKDQGYWFSIAYTKKLWKSFYWEAGIRYVAVTFKTANNSSITYDTNNSRYIAYIQFPFKFGNDR